MPDQRTRHAQACHTRRFTAGLQLVLERPRLYRRIDLSWFRASLSEKPLKLFFRVTLQCFQRLFQSVFFSLFLCRDPSQQPPMTQRAQMKVEQSKRNTAVQIKYLLATPSKMVHDPSWCRDPRLKTTCLNKQAL